MATQGVDPPSVADRQWSWVDRLPAWLRPYAVLARWDRPIGTWLLLLPCWWGAALAAALARSVAARAVRDRRGRDARRRLHDQRPRRPRLRPQGGAHPQPAAGERPARRARRRCLFSRVSCWSASLVLLTLNPLAVAGRARGVPLVVVYPFMKRITWWPQAFLGLTFNWGVLVGCAAVDRRARPRRRSCSTPPGSSGPWATTRSTPTRTRRTTPDRRASPPRCCWAPRRPAGCGASMASPWRCSRWPAALGRQGRLASIWRWSWSALHARRQVADDRPRRSGRLPRALPRQSRGRPPRLRWRSSPAVASDGQRLRLGAGLRSRLGCASRHVWSDELGILADRALDRTCASPSPACAAAARPCSSPAVVHHLLDGHGLPFLGAVHDGRYLGARLIGEHRPDAGLPLRAASTPTSPPARRAGRQPPSG